MTSVLETHVKMEADIRKRRAEVDAAAMRLDFRPEGPKWRDVDVLLAIIDSYRPIVDAARGFVWEVERAYGAMPIDTEGETDDSPDQATKQQE